MSMREFADQLFEAAQKIFGEPVQYTRKGSNEPLSVEGVFHQDYLRLNGGVSTRHSMIQFARATLPFSPRKEDEVIARGTRFRVSEVQLANEGQLKLILRKENEPQKRN